MDQNVREHAINLTPMFAGPKTHIVGSVLNGIQSFLAGCDMLVSWDPIVFILFYLYFSVLDIFAVGEITYIYYLHNTIG